MTGGLGRYLEGQHGRANRGRRTPCPKPLKLYDFEDAPNPRRTRGFMVEKGVNVPRERVDLARGEHRSEAFLRINPLGQVPVLELDDGTIIAESIAICRYLEELHPEPTLFGDDAPARARIEMWNRRVEFQLLRTIGDVAAHTDPLFADRVEQNAAYAAVQRRAAADKWGWLDRELANGRSFVAGTAFSVADLTGMAASWLGEQLGIEIPSHLKHVRRWDERMRNRRSWRA